MSRGKVVVELRVKSKAPREGLQAYQAEIVELASCQIRCRFAELPRPGRYNLVIGTRGEKGPSYKLRCVRHPVRVLG